MGEKKGFFNGLFSKEKPCCCKFEIIDEDAKENCCPKPKKDEENQEVKDETKPKE